MAMLWISTPLLALLNCSHPPLQDTARKLPDETADIVVVTGGRSVERWHRGEEIQWDGEKYFLTFGTISISTRHPLSAPIDVTVSGRGIDDMAFFIEPRRSRPFEAPHIPRRPQGNDGAVWVRRLRDGGNLTPVLRRRLGPGPDSFQLGYILRVPANSLGTEAEIVLGAADAGEYLIPISLEVQEASRIPVWFFSLMTGLAGTALGAIVGFFGFLGQQRFLRTSEETRRFDAAKVQNSRMLRTFFQGTYRSLRDSGQSPLRQVQLLREALVDEGIYALLRLDDVKEVSRICDPDAWRGKAEAKRVTKFDNLLLRNFGEFMQ
jgi:hypothetical protein